DFDSDGDLDLYVASGSNECGDDTSLLRDRLYVNDGAGGFARAPDGVIPDVRISASCVAAADYDRDGDVDLFVGGRLVPGRYPYAPPSLLLRNDGGRFVDVTDEVAPMCRDLGMVSSACWTDLDDDGFVDLVVAAQWQPLRVLGNEAGAQLVDRTAALGLDGVRGLWNGVISTDLDQDGDLDLVVTNLGLNTKYKASAKKPMELFARDFDDNGTVDVVEAKRSGDRTLPVRGWSCSSQAMPFVREKFPTFDQFAKATLGDIYGEQLDECLELSCNELRHVWFENDAGRFRLHALPRRAQLSTSFGVLAADAPTGGVELWVAHNFFSPEPETGRTDGGLGARMMYQGATCVGAEVLDARFGDHRGLLRVRDGAGRMSVLHLRNDDASSVTRLEPRGVQVTLAGPSGNPTGIGAKLVWAGASGKVRVREVVAGDGYLTQSSAAMTFPGGAGEIEVRWPDGDVTKHELT
ncbi:MAG: CRTAC1 family protein, partial [Planctomycetota bacterium]|nr:CRTAC1 family protein [Planctomycetota bacterium]